MSNKEFSIEDTDWSQKLETDYQEYLWLLESAIDYDADEDAENPVPETLSGEIFCGCEVCYTREQLFFLVPRIIKAYKEGKITLHEE